MDSVCFRVQARLAMTGRTPEIRRVVPVTIAMIFIIHGYSRQCIGISPVYTRLAACGLPE
jgi:hypothetical protein